MNVKMLKERNVKCMHCDRPATKAINRKFYCASCGDGVLMVTIKKCIEGVEEAVVKISVMPKRDFELQKKL